jgi:aryl-alcohol dehydrogenase-like predicted oxidoreductase
MFFQVQLSLLSRQPVDSGLLDTCRELKVSPIGYSPLALGLLSGKYTGDPEVFFIKTDLQLKKWNMKG